MNRKIKVRKDQFLQVVDILYDQGYHWRGGEARDGINAQDAVILINNKMDIRYCDIDEESILDLTFKNLTNWPVEEVLALKKCKQSKNLKMALKEVLEKKFVFIDEVAEILEIGKKTGKNVFLYGRGGHGKSEIIQEVLKFIDPKGQDSFVQACGEGLSEEKLFGGLNLAKFQKTGEIEYLVENSFMNKKYVVFEELLDSRMNVLLSLKDILTSGIFRQGSQQFKIKTEFVICLTNRTKQEVGEDNSVKALLERFPLEQKVEWNRYESADYQLMFQKVLGSSITEVADICQCINETGDFVSPRTAIHMAQVYKATNSVNALKFFGASSEIITKMEKLKKDQDDRNYLTEQMSNLENFEYDSDDISSTKAYLDHCKILLSNTANKSFSDKVFQDFVEYKKELEQKISETKELLLNLL